MELFKEILYAIKSILAFAFFGILIFVFIKSVILLYEYFILLIIIIIAFAILDNLLEGV